MPRTNDPDSPVFKPEIQEQNRDVNALFSSFHLDQPSYRTFNRHRNSRPPERAEAIQVPQNTELRTQTAIFSPVGGSGKSTLTASLAGVLWQLGKSVLLVDASPWPNLPFHYGAANTRPGLRSFFAPDRSDLPIRILVRDPNLLTLPDTDTSLVKEHVDHVLFDLSGVSGKELSAYLQTCQLLLVPLLPDASSVRTVEAMSSLLANLQNPPQHVRYIVNQMEDTPLALDSVSRLTSLLGDQLFHKPIYWQSEIPEALSEGVALPLHAPKAQAVSICNEIAQWVELPKAPARSKAQTRWSER